MIHIFKLINKGVKMKKVLSILAIICGSLAILSEVVPMLIGIILGMATPSSVGFIGGADGPTVIMIAGSAGIWSVIAVLAIGILLLATGIWGLRRKEKQDG